MQQQAAYALFDLRMWLVPATQFASYAYSFLFFIGLFLSGHWFRNFIDVAIGLFTVITIFQLITLPVEFDASRRAKQQLLKLGLVQPNEAPAVSAVLGAAAMTYVAALVTSVLQLLRLIMIANRSNRD